MGEGEGQIEGKMVHKPCISSIVEFFKFISLHALSFLRDRKILNGRYSQIFIRIRDRSVSVTDH